MRKMSGWDLASSCYFTFITLTTIGFDNNSSLFINIELIVAITMSRVRFGDMVPGQNDMGSGGMGLEQIAKMTVIMLFCSTDVHCENIEKWL